MQQRRINQSKFRQAGSTLAEFMLWGALSAGVIVLGVAGYRYSKAQSDTSRTALEFRQLQTAARTLTNGIYPSGSLNASLISAKAIPGSLAIPDSSTITNSFGYPVTITGNTSSVSIKQEGIPKEVCVQTLVDLNKTAWDSIQVGSAAAITSFPIDINTAATACAADYNTVTTVGR